MRATPLLRPEPTNGYPDTVPEEERVSNPTWHRVLMALLMQALEWFYRDVERVAVESDLLFFYEPGNRRRHVAPDVFVVRGAERRFRRNWLAWVEGMPEFVIELASESTVANDLGEKFRLYRDVLRVREYFLFDCDGGLLTPRLQGFRLVGEEYVPIEAVEGRFPSEVTGLHLEQHEATLRLWDPTTEAWVPTEAERTAQEAARANEEAERADEEAERADSAARRARAEARRARAAEERVEAETQRAEAEARRAEAEANRARAAKEHAEAETRRAGEEARRAGEEARRARAAEERAEEEANRARAAEKRIRMLEAELARRGTP